MGMAGINTQLDGRGPPAPAHASANTCAPFSLFFLLFRFGFFFFPLGSGCCLWQLWIVSKIINVCVFVCIAQLIARG